MSAIIDRPRGSRRAAFCGPVALALVLCGAAPALAAPTVSSTADSGPGSLRQAIVDAAPGDTITVPAGLYTLTGGALAVSKSLTLAGAGSATTTISGAGNSGVVAITAASTVKLSDLTVRDGLIVPPAAAQGAGVAISGGGALTLDRVVVTANTVNASATAANTGGGTVRGAGVYAAGATLTLRSSSVSGNFATSAGSGTGGGGSTQGGIIFSDSGTVSVTDSSIDNNIVNVPGGASGGSGASGGVAQGGILSFNGGLSLETSSVSDNRVSAKGRGTSGGGLAQGGAINATGPGNITIDRSNLDGNVVDTGSGTSGGGGLVQGGVMNCSSVTAAGLVSITASTIHGGSVGARASGTITGGLVQGGVILCGGELRIAGSSVRDTRIDADGGPAGSGGLVQGGVMNYSGPKLTVTDSTVRDTRVTARGGGAGAGGTVQGAGLSAVSSTGIRVADSTLAGNSADANGGPTGAGGSIQAGAASFSVSGSAAISLTSTTVSNNSVTAAAGTGGSSTGGTVNAAGLVLGLGGASASATLTNVTVSGNAASAPGGGANGNGGSALAGGVQVTGVATLTIASSTLAGNTAAAPGGGTGAAGIARGGNLHHGSTPVVVRDTIIAGGTGNAGKENCDTPATSQGHNLDSADQCGFSATSDQVGKDPLLAALADNGGKTQTRAPAVDSPAIDAGGPLVSTDPLGCPATDQRGVARPQRAACDVGAFELEFADLSMALAATPAQVPVGTPIAFTVGVANRGTAAAPATVAVTLPSDVALISAVGPGAACAGTAPLTCTLPSLAAGASAAVTVTLRPQRPGAVVATAKVSSPVADPNPADNTATAVALALPGPPARPTTRAMTLTDASLSPKTFALSSKRPRRSGDLPRFTTIRFRLSSAAGVRLTFTRATTGRLSGRRCVRATRATTRRRRCTRYVAAGGLTHAGQNGANRIRFTGRISKRALLRPGRHRVTLVATDATKKRSAPRTLTFTLRPAARQRR